MVKSEEKRQANVFNINMLPSKFFIHHSLFTIHFLRSEYEAQR